MLRTALGLGVVAVLFAAAGCRMCCHPYDYCGPVYDGDGCQSCSPHARTGSILSGTPAMAPSPTLARRQVQEQPGAPELAPSPTLARRAVQEQTVQGPTMSRASLQRQVQADVRPGDVPGSEQILSVTDRVIEPSAVAGEPSQLASESSTESAKPLPSQGWTARRPTPEVRR